MEEDIYGSDLNNIDDILEEKFRNSSNPFINLEEDFDLDETLDQ